MRTFNTILTLAFLSVSSNSFCQVYLNAGIGNVAMDTEIKVEDDVGFRLGGGYEFSSTFAIEVNYVELGDHGVSRSELSALEQELAGTLAPGLVGSIDSITYELMGFEFAVVATLPINEKFDLYGRIGAFSWESESEIAVTVSDGDEVVSNSQREILNGSDTSFAFGAAFNVSDNLRIGGEYANYTARDVDSSFFSVSAKLTF